MARPKPHPGVILLPPNNYRGLAMRWHDPDTGQVKTQRIKDKDECIAKSKELFLR